jgi:plasmid stability protein
VATLNVKNLPDALYRRLRKRARESHRSTAQEVTHILSVVLAEPDAHSILALRGLGREAWQGLDAGRHVADERAAWD